MWCVSHPNKKLVYEMATSTDIFVYNDKKKNEIIINEFFRKLVEYLLHKNGLFAVLTFVFGWAHI